ncbi:MAG: hypothetical protein Kow0073_08780 [Immundisolibacter sp.]
MGDTLRWRGTSFGQALDDADFAAAVHVLPVRDFPGNPEGFGMVAIEAVAHGRPTVAYATGGVVDAVREGQCGRLPPGDVTGFAQAVLATLASPPYPGSLPGIRPAVCLGEFGRKGVGELRP